MKRILWVIVAVLLLAACFAWFIRTRKDVAGAETVAYTYTKPERRDLRQTVTVNGSIAPVLSTELKSEISGRIARVFVNAGTVVTEGQHLVELDQRTLQVQIDEARLSIAASELRVQRARLEHERVEQLAARAFVNEKERKEAEINFLLSKNDLESQRARLRLLENSLGKATLIAPYAGTILSVAARPGMVVTGADAGREGNTLMELADLNHLRVEASVNEIDVARLSVGQAVDISFESVPEAKAEGRITFISPAAGKSADGGSTGGGGGGQNRSKEFAVQVGIEKSHPRVKPGMTARISIVTDRVEAALSVEVTAIFADFTTDETFVYLRDTAGGAPVKTPVVIGVRDALHAELKSGVGEDAELSLQRPPADTSLRTTDKSAKSSPH